MNKTITSCPNKKILRKTGIIKDQKGIINRFLREKQHWQTHMENTQNFITQAAAHRKKHIAVILGSGWLLDIPLQRLSQMFEVVHLYDIYHPPQIVKKVKNYSNVKLFQADISGGKIQLAYEVVRQFKRKKEKNLPAIFDQGEFQLSYKSDLVISCNILTQLNTLITSHLKRKPIYSDQELKTIAASIQEQHIKFLKQQNGCLITEYEEELHDRNNNLGGIKPLLHTNVPEGINTQKWQWKFDTKMFYRENFKTYFNVIATDLREL